MKKRYEVECMRRNVTLKGFWKYCELAVEKRTNGKASLHDWIQSVDDFENPYQLNNESWKHDFGKEICKTLPCEWQFYLEKNYNFIMEFDWWDEHTGTGYLYMVEFDDEEE